MTGDRAGVAHACGGVWLVGICEGRIAGEAGKEDLAKRS